MRTESEIKKHSSARTLAFSTENSFSEELRYTGTSGNATRWVSWMINLRLSLILYRLFTSRDLWPNSSPRLCSRRHAPRRQMKYLSSVNYHVYPVRRKTDGIDRWSARAINLSSVVDVKFQKVRVERSSAALYIVRFVSFAAASIRVQNATGIVRCWCAHFTLTRRGFRGKFESAEMSRVRIRKISKEECRL